MAKGVGLLTLEGDLVRRQVALVHFLDVLDDGVSVMRKLLDLTQSFDLLIAVRESLSLCNRPELVLLRPVSFAILFLLLRLLVCIREVNVSYGSRRLSRP